MNKYVKIKYQDGKISPYLLYVDENYVWSEEKIKSENAKAVSVSKMAFLNHGEPLIPMEAIPDVNSATAAYLQKPKSGVVLLVYEGGTYLTLMPYMEIVEEVYSEFYPIQEGSAIACENDPFDKWRGGLDHIFSSLAKAGGANSFHYMFSFRDRTEEEVIDAFKKAPAIIFWSSYKDADWWELMIRCIIKSETKAKVVGRCPSIRDGEAGQRFDKFVEMAKKFGVEIIVQH